MKLTSLPILALLSTAAIGCEIHINYDETPPQAPSIAWADATGRSSAVVGVETPYDFSGIEAFTVDVLDAPDGEITTSISIEAGRSAGAIQELIVNGLRPGAESYLSVSALDELGNRSEASVVGPIVTDFDYSGAIFPPAHEDGDNAFGYQIAHGDFDADGHEDVAVAAPFKASASLAGAGAIYVYRGAASGLDLAAPIVIDGTEAYAQLGNALTVLDWNGDGTDDLVAGAPFASGGAGAVTVYDGSSLASGSPSVLATLVSDNEGWFDGAALGFTLTTTDWNGDAHRDLVIGAVAGGGNGGALVVLGTARGASGELVLSDSAPQLRGMAAVRLVSPRSAELFGMSMADLGAIPRATGSGLAVAGFQSDAVIIYRGGAATQPGLVTDHEWSFNRDLEVVSDLPREAYFGAALGSVSTGGERELVVGAYRAFDGDGMVALVDLSSYGTVALAEVASAIIRGEEGAQLGTAVANNGSALRSSERAGADIDADGLEDLVVVGGSGEVELLVWYGDDLPTGEAFAADAHHRLYAPTGMQGEAPTIGGTPATATWVGDVDADGLDDLAWADWTGNGADGLLELLR